MRHPAVASPAHPARGSLYGHGLLGSATRCTPGTSRTWPPSTTSSFCATDWWGMSEGDVGYDITALQDLNMFPPVVDRLQQGVLNTLYLGG